MVQEAPSIESYGGVWERQIRSARTIPNESLRTHLAETKAISNSSSLIVDTFGDMQSEQTILASNIIAMKSKVGLPPPGHFVKADEFLVRLRKEFPWSLQSRHKWNEKHRYFQNVDIVLLKTDANRNQWAMVKVVRINSEAKDFVQSVKLLN